jgi:hypothetical protein
VKGVSASQPSDGGAIDPPLRVRAEAGLSGVSSTSRMQRCVAPSAASVAGKSACAQVDDSTLEASDECN